MNNPMSDDGSAEELASQAKAGKSRWVLWLLGYVALMSLVTWGMFRGRESALQAYRGDEAREDWEQWREEAKTQAAGEGPVTRRIPKSSEPPALVLMRDYFWQCLAGAWVVSSALGLSMAFLFGGMLRSSSWEPIADPVHPALKRPPVN